MITGIVCILPTNPATDCVDTTEGRSVDYQQLRQAVSKAVWQKDHTTFRALIDDALLATYGEDHGAVLVLEATWFLVVDAKNAARGFVLVDEALPLVRKNPATLLDCLITALGLCHLTGDSERARTYEEEAYSFLLTFGSDPEVRAKGHRLQLGLGQIAYLRGDYASAYWHLVQAANGIANPSVSDAERRGFESLIQMNVAMACLRTRRFYECQEALDLADKSNTFEPQRLRLAILHAELLRQLGETAQAADLLSSIATAVEVCKSPGVQARYHWIASLVAYDSGDLPGFHRKIAVAMEMAASHQQDFLLNEIQRFQGSTQR